MLQKSYVYIITNKKHGVLYIGITNNLLRRIYEHKEWLVKGFSKKYNLHTLIRYEVYENITEAIKREKQLKNRKRQWKIELVEKENPEWRDLYDEIIW